MSGHGSLKQYFGPKRALCWIRWFGVPILDREYEAIQLAAYTPRLRLLPRAWKCRTKAIGGVL